MSRKHTNVQEILLPADIPAILDEYEQILGTYGNIPGENNIYPDFRKKSNLLSVLFPLKEHPIHGMTGIHAIERYKDGSVTRYSYQWKIIIPKLGISSHHISAWGNDPHDEEWTKPEF
ncbi:hypothetical protein ACERII_25220 [Evansella sp. AB-rgal1]|uniref:hypothetical protein n=1 Tax=Evansella sp. AB-rgal1 TaxID=3242696 RepID=UPI00359DA4C3